MKVTIFYRLVIGYIIIFSLVATVNIYTIYQFGQVNHVTHSVVVIDNRILDLQKKLTDSFLSQMRYEKKIVVMKDYALYDHFLLAKADFDKDLKQAMLIAGSSNTMNLLETVGKFSQQYQSLVVEEIEHMKANQPYDRDWFAQKKDQTINKTITELKKLEDYSRQSTYNKIKGLDLAVANSRSVAFVINAATLIIGIIISIIITRGITKPLAAIKKKTQEIAKGNFESTVNLSSPPEVSELANAFNFMCAKLKEVDKMKSDFLSLMSHELRTPLTSIQEGANLLLEGVGGKVTDKQKRLLNIIEEEDKRLIRLVNSLLDLSKMEAGMMAYNFVQADLIPLVKKAILEIEPLSQAKNIRLEAKNSDELLQVKMDPKKIDQALRNLIGNAVKFTPHGGRVTISTRVTDIGAEVSVSDTGPGIHREDLEIIFDKYQQARRADLGSTKGTGLGLAIVKHIINAHGGTVWVESEPGKGSTFTFALPS